MPARRVVVVAAAALLGAAGAGAIGNSVTVADGVGPAVVRTGPPLGSGPAFVAPMTAPPAPAEPGTAAGPVARPATPSTVPRGQVPLSVSVPSIGLTSSIQPEGVNGRGLMQIPDDLRVAGWYRYGARPGQGTGATVLAAHVDTAAAGIGPWAALRTVRVGDLVTVRTAQGTLRYQVAEIDRIRKSMLDTASLFSSAGPERLHLVTCGGRFDRSTGHYQDNVVVVAYRTGKG